MLSLLWIHTAEERSRRRDKKKLFIKAVRYIHNAGCNSHAGPIFTKFNILKFHDLVNLNQACFMYKFINNKLPLSFQNFFQKLNNFDRSQSLHLTLLKRSNLQYFPSYAIPRLWNSLSLDLKRKGSLNTFKKYYAKYLSQGYSTPCTVANCYSCRK